MFSIASTGEELHSTDFPAGNLMLGQLAMEWVEGYPLTPSQLAYSSQKIDAQFPLEAIIDLKC